MDENPARALSPREIVETSISHEPYNKPGEGGHYSNANYKALGLIAEKVTGKNLGIVIREKIINRLGLEKTIFATKPEIKGEQIHGYALLPDRTIDITVRPDIWILWASGNMVSNLEDQKKWTEALGRGTLLSKESYQEMTDWIEIEAALPGKFNYGLGVDKIGESASVDYRPRTIAYQVEAEVGTVSSDKEPQIEITSPADGRIIVRGEVPEGYQPVIRICGIEDSASWFFMVCALLWIICM